MRKTSTLPSYCPRPRTPSASGYQSRNNCRGWEVHFLDRWNLDLEIGVQANGAVVVGGNTEEQYTQFARSGAQALIGAIQNPQAALKR